ncbi:hypothetical protein JCGZ_09970 [Jatropha curcas]|uniref:Legume lectin domain-containing protein n=1 Tax=Jatropha curcas TaxID=180498 RepID=A0A067KJF5_JATCU|nr:hypothetical protein JCGZ_09970 [Jatropha curcas]
MGDSVLNSKDYTLLKDFRMEVEIKGGNFFFSFWISLINSVITFPAIIINQIHSDIASSAPFLCLNEKKIMMLFPLPLEYKEALDSSNSASLSEAPHISMENEFPLENWIHVGCGVFTDVLHLHINGEIVGECPFSSSINKDSFSNGLGKITLIGAHGNEGLQGYVYNAEVLPLSLSIKDHYFKASCRRIFSIDVVLSNAISQSINNEVEVAAFICGQWLTFREDI